MADDLRSGNAAVPPFLPPRPAGAPLAPDARRAPPPLRGSPLGEAAERGERGAVGAPRSRGRAGRGPFEPCRWPWRNPARPISAARVLAPPAGRPWFARLPRVQFPLLGERSERSCQYRDGALRDERLRPHRAEGVSLGPLGRGVPAAGGARAEAVVPPGPGNRAQGPASRGF